MIKIALTGGIGVGKSRAAKAFEARGVRCLDADAVVHSLYENNKQLKSDLCEAFGPIILTQQSEIDRKALGSIVFSDKEKLLLLNRIVHKYVKTECDKWFSNCASEGARAALLEAPQLYEAGMEDWFDVVIAVTADRETRIKRICERDSISDEAAGKIIDSQLSDEKYISGANYIIYNNCNDINGLDEQIGKILAEVGL